MGKKPETIISSPSWPSNQNLLSGTTFKQPQFQLQRAHQKWGSNVQRANLGRSVETVEMLQRSGEKHFATVKISCSLPVPVPSSNHVTPAVFPCLQTSSPPNLPRPSSHQLTAIRSRTSFRVAWGVSQLTSLWLSTVSKSGVVVYYLIT